MYCYMLCNAMYYLLCALIHCAVLGCSFLDLDRVQRLHALSGALFTHGHTLAHSFCDQQQSAAAKK